MDLGIAFGLLIQAMALALLFWRVGRQWMTHTGAVFIILATAYHGLNEMFLWIVPDRDPYRFLVRPQDIESFVVWISFAILLLTCVYVVALQRPVKPQTPNIDQVRRIFDWRLMLLAAIPLLILTIVGNGFSVDVAASTPLGTAAGLASQFLLIGVMLASFGFIVRFGRVWLLPALFIQSLAIAIVGQRLEILVCATLLLYALARIGIKLRRREWIAGLAAFAVAATVITSARATQGHLTSTSSGDLRLGYLAAGVSNIGSPSFWNEVSFAFGYRLDGNSYGAMELAALNFGYPPLGITPLVNDVLIAVPSFLNPDKVYAPLETRSEKEYAEVNLGLPLPYVAPGCMKTFSRRSSAARSDSGDPGGP